MSGPSVVVSLVMTLASAAQPLQAPDWQAVVDPLASSAAAALVVHLNCSGTASANAAMPTILKRLSQAAAETALMHGARPADVASYTSDSLGLKVRAITQSSGLLPCERLDTLRTLARANGFDTP